jgi:hypothetical protein
LALALGLLLAALWAGLIRLGWGWPPLIAPLPMAHGPLMIGGFLGTLIGLERAIGLGRRWAYAAPILAGSGAGLVALGVMPWGSLLIAAGSLALLAVMLDLVRQHPATYTAVLAAAAACWFVGNLLWLAGYTVAQVVLWWLGFLVLTIAGERLELSRMLRLPRWAHTAFIAVVAGMALGMALSVPDYATGTRLTGLAWVLLAVWLLRFDIAQRRVRAGGQARYMAICLLSGYVWLAVAGVLALAFGGLQAGPRYDAMIHALALGFVFAMIFAHALIIFPAVLGVDMVYRPRFYLPLVLLHAGLALRIAGDLLPWWPARQWGGLLSAVAILWFLANTVTAIRRHPAPRASSDLTHATPGSPVH